MVNPSWGIGSASGPLLAGVLMHAAGVNALPPVLWVAAALFLPGAFWERRNNGLRL